MKTVKSSDVLKAYYPDPGDKSLRADAVRNLAQSNAALHRRYNLLAMHVLSRAGHAAATPHNDNTGMPCRFDPLGHDCCEICNDAEDALRAALQASDGHNEPQ